MRDPVGGEVSVQSAGEVGRPDGAGDGSADGAADLGDGQKDGGRDGDVCGRARGSASRAVACHLEGMGTHLGDRRRSDSPSGPRSW